MNMFICQTNIIQAHFLSTVELWLGIYSSVHKMICIHSEEKMKVITEKEW